MTILSRLLAASAVAVSVFTAGAALAQQSFTPQQRGEIETIIRDYFIKHPEMIEELQALAQSEKIKKVIVENKDVLLNSPRQVTLGNPNGDVTMVEFFDYNCGFCKRALDDMMTLMKNNPNLRVVLKEMPVLEPGQHGCGAGRGRGRDAGQERQALSRLPPEAAQRPRSGRQGARAGRRPRKSVPIWPGSKRT